ncbi:MAG: hypothetical protein CVV27_11410, partial [Candidatus Melainabacteria bacterium HGW-Melainabacteria-1]
MSTRQRLLIAMIQDICRELEIQLTPLADHWVLRLERGKIVRHICGYQFESNRSAPQQLAQDKFACWSVLQHCGVPAV